MPFPDSQFDAACQSVDDQIDRPAFGRFRERLRDRGRLRPLFDEGWEFLGHRGQERVASDRVATAELLKEHLQDRRDTFGVPVIVFAILLKVVVSILIDIWLLRGHEGGAK